MDLNDKKTVRAIAKRCYPEYKGRKIRVVESKDYTMRDYWDGGSRDYAKAYELKTGFIAEPKAAVHTPWHGAANATFDIPPGVAIVEHTIFCGKDAGITIYVTPARELPEGRRVTVLSMGGAA
jgi:hypothetical protein